MKNVRDNNARHDNLGTRRANSRARQWGVWGLTLAFGVTFGLANETFAQRTNVRSSAYTPDNQILARGDSNSGGNRQENGIDSAKRGFESRSTRTPIKSVPAPAFTERASSIDQRTVAPPTRTETSVLGFSDTLNVASPRRQSFYGVNDVKSGNLSADNPVSSGVVSPELKSGSNYLKVQRSSQVRSGIVQTSTERIVSTSIPTPTNRVGVFPESISNGALSPAREEDSNDDFSLLLTDDEETLVADGQTQVESLETAINIALSQSRTQSALAYKRDAARSTTQAASSLRNPKINTTNAYVGLLNKPTTISDVDVSSAITDVTSSLPPAVTTLLEPVLGSLPTNLQAATPLTDRNFVTSTTSVTIPLYLGGRVRALEEAASALTQAASAGIAVDEQRVKLETTEAYFLVLRAQQLLQVARESVAAAQEHLNDAERMYNVGMLTKNVTLAAQVALSESRQLQLKLENVLSLAESAYNRLLWRPLDTPVRLADVDLGDPLGNISTLTESALQTRNEIVALNAEARAVQAQARVARADVLPQVAAVGAYTYFENSHMRYNSNATAAVGVTWTPFDGGTSRARQNAARQGAMALARAREEAESLIRLQVRQACLAENEARERLNVAQIAAEQAEENYRVVTRGFQEGVLNHTEVLDAATMRTATKSALANAKYDAILATERVKSAVGVL